MFKPMRISTGESRGSALTKLGVVTIGQSPRVDMVPEMERHWPGITVLERGALDGWDAGAIAATPVREGDELLTSWLSDETSVVFGRDLVLPLIQQRIDELERDGVDATLLLCTGTFPSFTSQHRLFTASPLFIGGVRALATDVIGVLCPLAKQEADSANKFAPSPVIAASADPYSATEDDYRNVATGLADRGATTLVLDCMGYTEQHRSWVQSATGLPVVLARSIVSRLVGEALAA